MADTGSYDKIVWSSCNVNCGSRCPLRLFVKDGKVVKIDQENSGDTAGGVHEIRACLRGRSLRQWIYSKERLLHPLLRNGPRGSGQFKQVSWDQALTFIAGQLQRVISTYGNEAVYRNYGTGVLGGVISAREQIDRLMNLLGGRLNYHNSYSTAQIKHAMLYTFGQELTGNNLSDLANSRLVVFFGNNTAETRMSGGGSVWDLIHAKQENNVRIIVIDPRYTDTAVSFADEWIPIRPGTDAALASALAYVLICENHIDSYFLANYCVGYDTSTMPEDIPGGHSYREYILGHGYDRTPKTPDWAAAITGIPANRIIKLAKEIGTSKPVYIAQGWGPQRHANGEQSARAICMLAVLTGNVGIQGGNTGDRERPTTIPFPKIPVGDNPVKTSIPCFLWTKAIADPHNLTAANGGLKGKEKLDTGIKFLWSYASNTLINQHSDITQTKKILADETLCEMIVAIDTVMTASTNFADVILPGTSSFEESDLCYQGSAMEIGELIIKQRAIEPLGESRSLFDICSEMASRLGVGSDFTEDKTQEQWVEHLYSQCRHIKPELPVSYEQAKEMGLFKWARPGKSHVGLQKFRKDPKQYPLNTPSGKIEIFSHKLWQLGKTWELPAGDVISGLPEYHPTWGSPSRSNNSSYPLQCIGPHYKQRTHSSYGNNPWLLEVAPQMVWVNPYDAKERGIFHGDTVRIFNQFGETLVRAKVTPRIIPGVISLPQGAWHREGPRGIDLNGCINILTNQRPSPLAKGNPQHTNLVQMEKVRKGKFC